MKKILQITLICLLADQTLAQDKTLKTINKNIIGPCNDSIILRGINYAIYNWGWSPNENYISEIAKTGANCVRINWYKNGGAQTPTNTYNDPKNLDSALSISIRHKMIPILSLHDETCKNSTNNLSQLVQWFTRPLILNVLKKHQHSLIINVANEALFINWSSNKNQARLDFKQLYKNAIDSLRNVGLKCPLMIDAPDCGQSLNELANLSNEIGNHDPLKNIIFSAHAYWYAYANNDSSTMLSKINDINQSNYPFIFGEIANQQDDQQNCQYEINYKALLNICQTKKIGWLAWSWNRDVCPNRQVSNNGLANNLSSYGNDIVNNQVYGISKTSLISEYLANGLKCQSLVTNSKQNSDLKIYPNPTDGSLNIYLTDQNYEYRIRDLYGNLLLSKTVKTGYETIELNLERGIYILEIVTKEYLKSIKIVKN